MQVHKECYRCKLVCTGISGVGGGGGGGHSPPRLVLRCRSRIKILGNFFFGGQFCPTKMFSMPTQTPIFLPFPFFLETVKKERNRTIYVETFFFEIILLGTEKPFQYQWRHFWGGGEIRLFGQKTDIFFKQKNAGDQLIFRAKFNASSHFSGKSLVLPQIILSFYAHDRYDEWMVQQINDKILVLTKLTQVNEPLSLN